MQDAHSSPIINEAIRALSRLPGIGQKSAQRIVFYLLRRDQDTAKILGNVLPKLVAEIHHCVQCRNFTSLTICELCEKRHTSTEVCVVESPMDILAIEQSSAFFGRYFVLHGCLSPIDGLGPKELGLDVLEQQVKDERINELIIATSGNIDGETTAHFIKTRLAQYPIAISRIAQGIPMGGELEYTDSATLARALQFRQTIAGHRS